MLHCATLRLEKNMKHVAPHKPMQAPGPASPAAMLLALETPSELWELADMNSVLEYLASNQYLMCLTPGLAMMPWL